MQRKNKVMLAAAIGMVAVIIGSTAVRCSIAHTVEEGAGTEAQTATEVIAQDAGSPDVAGASPATTAPTAKTYGSGMAILTNGPATNW